MLPIFVLFKLAVVSWIEADWTGSIWVNSGDCTKTNCPWTQILGHSTNAWGVNKIFSTIPQVGLHSLGWRFPALDLVTGLVIWRCFVAVVLRRRVGSGTTSGWTRSRVGRPRVSSLFRPARRVRFIATRRVLKWAGQERQSSNHPTGLVLVRCGGMSGSPLTDLIGAAVWRALSLLLLLQLLFPEHGRPLHRQDAWIRLPELQSKTPRSR